MKRLWKRIVGNTDVEPKIELCCNCGKKKMRQTTLKEFGFEFHYPGQTKLSRWSVTESVGLHGDKRKYRGNV